MTCNKSPEDQWPTEHGLDHDRRVALLCYSQVCHLAARAAVEFARRGYSVMELEGGFPAWKSHGLPTEAGDATAHDSIDRTRAYLESRRAAEREASRAQAAPQPPVAPEPNAMPEPKAALEPKAAPEPPQAVPDSKAAPEPKVAPEPNVAP